MLQTFRVKRMRFWLRQKIWQFCTKIWRLFPFKHLVTLAAIGFYDKTFAIRIFRYSTKMDLPFPRIVVDWHKSYLRINLLTTWYQNLSAVTYHYLGMLLNGQTRSKSELGDVAQRWDSSDGRAGRWLIKKFQAIPISSPG